jgi:tRNA pseudouridine55 synthase
MNTNNKKFKQPPFLDSGILLVDKPAEWSSHDVVSLIRKRFNVKKVGHCGTLDPAATGLLVIVLGRATKLSQKLSGEDKTYEAEMLIGTETDSQDLDGTITAENSWSSVTEEQIGMVCEKFVGEQYQTPPMVSAKKVGGKRLYKLAREGKVIEREPVKINIRSLEITAIDLPYVNFTVSSSKGTYIRTLCYDIGRQLGCGAVLAGLRRIQCGIFSVENSVTVEKIKEWEQEELADRLLWVHNLQF